MNGVYHMNKEHYNSLLHEFKTKDAILKYVNESYNICYLITDIIVGE